MMTFHSRRVQGFRTISQYNKLTYFCHNNDYGNNNNNDNENNCYIIIITIVINIDFFSFYISLKLFKFISSLLMTPSVV